MGWRRVIESKLPFAARREIVRRRHPTRVFDLVDLNVHDAGPGVVIETYWLTTPTGECGPALSLRVLDEECWRIDLLSTRPHLHLNLIDNRVRRSHHDNRIQLPSDNVADAITLLRGNVPAPLSINGRQAIRNHVLDEAALGRAIDAAEAHMLELQRSRTQATRATNV